MTAKEAKSCINHQFHGGKTTKAPNEQLSEVAANPLAGYWLFILALSMWS